MHRVVLLVVLDRAVLARHVPRELALLTLLIFKGVHAAVASSSVPRMREITINSKERLTTVGRTIQDQVEARILIK